MAPVRKNPKKRLQIPRNVRWELARISTSPAVNVSSLTYSIGDDGTASIKLVFQTDTYIEPLETPIHDEEPIELLYPSESEVGNKAPRVLSNRNDFPRDLPHINPGATSSPADLCLARSGLQPIYDTSGVLGVLSRLHSWLNDAKTGNLHTDGWEPVPAAQLQESILAFLNLADMQEHAAAHPDGGIAFICADTLSGDGLPTLINADAGIIPTENVERIREATNSFQRAPSKNQAGQIEAAVPIIFVWPPKSRVETLPVFTTWCDISSIKAGIENVGLDDCIEEAMIRLNAYFEPNMGNRIDILNANQRGFVLMVGVWRPSPLDTTIVGLSKDDDARCLELRAFFLRRPIASLKDRWSVNTEVLNVYGMVPASREILEIVSGEPAISNITIVGMGALGSAMANYILRGGGNKLATIDKDLFLPHNIARHEGNRLFVAQPKVNISTSMAISLTDDLETSAHDLDFEKATKEEIEGILRNSFAMIDTTADASVRRELSAQKNPNIPLMRAELFHRGSLGEIGRAHV